MHSLPNHNHWEMYWGMVREIESTDRELTETMVQAMYKYDRSILEELQAEREREREKR